MTKNLTPKTTRQWYWSNEEHNPVIKATNQTGEACSITYPIPSIPSQLTVV